MKLTIGEICEKLDILTSLENKLREGEDLNEKYISFSNVVTLFMLTVLSFTITVSVMLYSITCLYIQSVIGKDDGSDIIRFLFRKIVIRNNNPIEFYRMIDNRNNNNNVIDV